MKGQKETLPPRWAERFLGWYCRPELLEDLQGDLNEYFERNLKTKGARKARLIYVLDVFKFLRLYTIRKPEFLNLLIQWIMLGSYIKTSGRSIARHKLFSSINIIGLAISMSVGLLTIAFISDLLSYDSFHEKNNRIYRVITTNQYLDHPPLHLASTSVKAGKKITETIPGVEALTLLRNGFGADAVAGETVLPISGHWADESFFNVFTFPLLQGDKTTALKQPYSIVLTEQSVKKLFGNDDALGKSVKFDTTDYVVTGVMKDIPKFSHLRFEALVSFATIESEKAKKANKEFFSWGSTWSNYVYLVLPQNGDLEQLQANLDRLSAHENAATPNTKITLSLQPLKKIALGRDLNNAIGPTMNIVVVWALGGLAFIVILSACFNYTNLSIARSLKRSREVGIRKVVGAFKGDVLMQFIAESVIIALLALVFSFMLFLGLRNQFLSLAADLDNTVSLELSPRIIVYFIAFAMSIGVLAGFLPALFFSRIKAVQVFKDVSSIKVFRNLNMRKALILIQYTFSLIFITTTLIGYEQYKGFLAFDLGFRTKSILNIKLKDNKSDLLIKELSELTGVGKISRSSMITSVGSMHGFYAKYQNLQDSALVWYNSIDEHYLPLHGHKLIAGRNFSAKSRKEEESEAIVNEQLLKRFDIDIDKALGEVLTTDTDKNKLTIVGVLKDFHYGTVESAIEPVMYRYNFEPSKGYINVSITTTELPATLAKIEKIWQRIDKVHPIDAKFYDDQIADTYNEYSGLVKIVGFLAFLAICISSMGLFGMVVFTTETKLKEISIRKVLGATEKSLVFLLSKGFLLLLIGSALVAIPATYLVFDKIVLTNFVYHEPIGMGELFTGLLAVMAIAFVMIGSQTLKVARSNMAEVLKNE